MAIEETPVIWQAIQNSNEEHVARDSIDVFPDVMRHEARARTEDGQIAAALLHLPKLIAFARIAQFGVADLQLGNSWLHRRVADSSDLAITPIFQGLWRCCVVTVGVNDHGDIPVG